MDIQPLNSNSLKKILNDSNQNTSQTYKLATGGADHQVRLWLIHPQQNLKDNEGNILQNPHQPRAEYLCTLSRHTNPVNVVRFCPKGETLASAGDDGNVLLWIPSDQKTASYGESSSEDLQFEKEFWRVRIMARCARDAEVYDLAWSPTGEYFVAGSTDNTARIFSAIDGVCLHQITEHSHYVQGVSWDPFGELLATQSSDRTLNVHNVTIRDTNVNVNSINKFSKADVSSHTPTQHRRSSSSSNINNNQRRSSIASEASSNLSENEQKHQLERDDTQVMNTPMKPPSSSRRSSISNKKDNSNNNINININNNNDNSIPQSNVSSPLTPTHKIGRSPSPIPPPPLPAIKPPPNVLSTINSKGLNERISYGDENYTQFFRRLSFSPDGSLLITPAGQSDDIPSNNDNNDKEDGKKRSISKSSVMIYGRNNMLSPLACLPGHRSATIGIKFNPVLYNLRDRKEKPAFDLPFRMIYAVISKESVIIYDTQQFSPISIFSNLHWAGFTDASWSPDGQCLMLASLDGYCSIIVFDPNELGVPYEKQQHQLQMSAIAQQTQNLVNNPSNSQAQQQQQQQTQQQPPVNQLPVKKKRRVELTRVEGK